jgi:hypothetical protein
MLGAPSILSRWHLNTPAGLRDRGATLDISKSCSRTGSVSAHSAPPLATGPGSVEPPERWGPRRLLITRLLSLGYAVEEHIVAGRGVLVITGAAPIVRARCADMAHGGCEDTAPSARRWRSGQPRPGGLVGPEMADPAWLAALSRHCPGDQGCRDVDPTRQPRRGPPARRAIRPCPQARSRSRCPATSSARLNGPRVTGPAQESGQQPQKSRRRRHNVLPRIGSMAAAARPQPFAPMRRKRIYPHWIKAELLNDIGSRLR